MSVLGTKKNILRAVVLTLGNKVVWYCKGRERAIVMSQTNIGTD